MQCAKLQCWRLSASVAKACVAVLTILSSLFIFTYSHCRVPIQQSYASLPQTYSTNPQKSPKTHIMAATFLAQQYFWVCLSWISVGFGFALLTCHIKIFPAARLNPFTRRLASPYPPLSPLSCLIFLISACTFLCKFIFFPAIVSRLHTSFTPPLSTLMTPLPSIT